MIAAASLTVTAASTKSKYLLLAEGKLPNSLANISILPQESWRCSRGFGVNEYAKGIARRLIEDYVDLGMERRTDEGRGIVNRIVYRILYCIVYSIYFRSVRPQLHPG